MDKKDSPRRIEKEWVDPAVRTLSEAFKDDPLFTWLMPDETVRRSLLPKFFHYRIMHGRLCGEVYVTSPSVEGIAIWLPHTEIDLTDEIMTKSGAHEFVRAADPMILKRLKTYGIYADDLHRQWAPFPHQILFLLAVRPNLQGQGYAGQLINAMLQRLDREKRPCFLETQSFVNTIIYQKYGFAIKSQGRIPGTDIPHWAMLREPKYHAAARGSC